MLVLTPSGFRMAVINLPKMRLLINSVVGDVIQVHLSGKVRILGGEIEQ